MASSYGKAKTNGISQVTSSFFGHGTSLQTFLSKINQCRLDMNLVVHNLLRDNHDVTVCCMDNNQRGYPMKFQMNGVSNWFVKVTVRLIKEATLFDVNDIDCY
jgi:hypothetical protein